MWSFLEKLPRDNGTLPDIHNVSEEEISDLVKGVGLCTSFSINVIDTAQLAGQFHLGDMGGHRAAFCEDGTVVDSSARKIVRLRDGEVIVAQKTGLRMTGLGGENAKLFLCI